MRILLMCLLVLSGSGLVQAAPYQLGYCSVSPAAADPACADVKGKKASGVAPGTTHIDCTNAKNVAKKNLLTHIPAACGKFVTCNLPCRTIQK